MSQMDPEPGTRPPSREKYSPPAAVHVVGAAGECHLARVLDRHPNDIARVRTDHSNSAGLADWQAFDRAIENPGTWHEVDQCPRDQLPLAMPPTAAELLSGPPTRERLDELRLPNNNPVRHAPVAGVEQPQGREGF